MALRGLEVLLIEKRPDGIMIITVNRPERQNKFTTELQQRLADAWADFKQDDDAIVAIVTANGDTFITGPDLEAIGEEERAGRISRFIPPFFPHDVWKPIICAVNGDACCGGLEMVNESDIRISAENATFGIAETQWSLMAPWVGALAASLTRAHAAELALWGDTRCTAQRMYEMGFLNRVVPREKLMDEAMSWAKRMLQLSPRTVQNLKQILWHGYTHSIPESRTLGMALEQNIWIDENVMEGIKAFTEGRQPKFKKLGSEWYWHGKEPLSEDIKWR